jgi:hypothetical protein
VIVLVAFDFLAVTALERAAQTSRNDAAEADLVPSATNSSAR